MEMRINTIGRKEWISDNIQSINIDQDGICLKVPDLSDHVKILGTEMAHKSFFDFTLMKGVQSEFTFEFPNGNIISFLPAGLKLKGFTKMDDNALLFLQSAGEKFVELWKVHPDSNPNSVKDILETEIK